MKYLGHLPTNDPFHAYLRHDILPLLNTSANPPNFRVYQLRASNHVYLYEDERSDTRIIGKFFGGVPHLDPEAALRHMEREYTNLNYLRSIGFNSYPHYIARPLGRNAKINKVVVEEYCHGTLLKHVILKAIREDARDSLFQKLTALAYFLATLHNRTAYDDQVDFNKECEYFERLIEQLREGGRLGWGEAEEFHQFKDEWQTKSCMWEDRRVFVHSDVTPANVLFGDGLWVIIIDLERMRPSDRTFDLGRLVGELQHCFMQHAGNKWQAEPFIGHFLWEYACHFPDRDSAFAAITQRLPFYAALTLLRIARNAWIGGDYSHQLVDEARKTLRQ